MKVLTYILALTILSLHTFGTTITATVNNGSWSTTTTWNPVRVPKDNDTILIPANLKVTYSGNDNLKGVTLIVYGTLEFTAGKKLLLNSNSTIIVQAGGMITSLNDRDEIRLGNDVIFSGDDHQPIVGYAYANSGSDGFVSIVLPVTYVSFDATIANDEIRLVWVIERQQNNDHFDVQRSIDGAEWKTVSTMKAKAANGNTYQYSEKKPSGKEISYRLKQVDANGQYTYSDVQHIRANTEAAETKLSLTPNASLQVGLSTNSSQPIRVRVFNANGQLIGQKTFTNGSNMYYNMNGHPHGLYIVQIIENQSVTTKKLML
jgi:hypothetical protein